MRETTARKGTLQNQTLTSTVTVAKRLAASSASLQPLFYVQEAWGWKPVGYDEQQEEKVREVQYTILQWE